MGLVMAGVICNLDRIWGLGPWACLWGIIILIMLSWDTAPNVPLWGCHSLPRILDCVSGETMLHSSTHSSLSPLPACACDDFPPRWTVFEL